VLDSLVGYLHQYQAVREGWLVQRGYPETTFADVCARASFYGTPLRRSGLLALNNFRIVVIRPQQRPHCQRWAGSARPNDDLECMFESALP
jgi:hypothetical protein